MEIIEFEEAGPLNGILLSDTHLSSKSTNEDYDVLKAVSDYAYENKVDFLHHLGDLGCFPSLNKSRGSSLMGGMDAAIDESGHDLQGDIESFKTGLKSLKYRYVQEAKKHKKNRHKERLVDTEFGISYGNHDDYIFAVKNKHRSLKGVLNQNIHNIDTICDIENFRHFPFRQRISINGLVLAHYFEAANPKNAWAIQRVKSEGSMSAAFGHNHKREAITWVNSVKKSLTVLNTGCTKHPSKLRNHESSGIYHIKNLFGGEYTYEWVPTTILLDRFYSRTAHLRHEV